MTHGGATKYKKLNTYINELNYYIKLIYFHKQDDANFAVSK